MDKMKPVFQALNKELIQENLTLTIICVDGYVLEYRLFVNCSGLKKS
ncbi:Uncharacterised protein [Streptococcus pneumoniae]|nr:Uncharacterised protein [Streptococcus pneumoniae]